MFRFQRPSGLTLVELLVVIALVAMAATLAAPAFIGTLATSRVQSAAQNLKQALDFMRSEAIRRGHNIVACPSTNGTTCTGGTAWAGGWLVWADADNDNTLDGGEIVILAQGPMATSLTIAGTTLIGLASTGAALAAGSLAVGYDGVTVSRTVCLSTLGASSVQDTTPCPT